MKFYVSQDYKPPRDFFSINIIAIPTTISVETVLWCYSNRLWFHAAFHNGVPELRSFVNKLHQDQQAVLRSLVLQWNNGMVEGHVNRLKFLKRSMYGRANFDVLRLRVLN